MSAFRASLVFRTRRCRWLLLALTCAALPACIPALFEASSPSEEEVVLAPQLLSNLLSASLAPSTSVTFAVRLQGGPDEAHQLAVDGGPPADVTVAFSTPSLLPGDSAMVTLTVNPATELAPGATRVIQLPITARGSGDRVTLTISLTIVPPFTMSAAGAFMNNPGATLQGTLSLSRFEGFEGPVALRFTNLPGGWTTTLPASTTGSSVPFTVAVPDTASPGLFALTIEGTFGGSTQTTVIAGRILEEVIPPDITISSAPDTVTVEAGERAEWLVSVARTAPGIGPVSFVASGVPANATASFTPAAVNDTTRLLVQTDATTPAGSYALLLTGTAGSIIRADTVTLVVETPRTLTMALAPSEVEITAGSSGEVMVSTQTTGNVPAIVFDAPANPAGFTTLFNTSGTDSTLTIAVGAEVTPGNYVVVARAQAGALEARDSVTVAVVAAPALAVAVTPDSVSVEAGASVQLLAVASTAGSVGAVTFDSPDLPTGFTAAFTPAGDSATLQIDVGATVPAGNYTVFARATAGTLSARDSAIVSVGVPTGGYSLTVPPSISLLTGQTATVPVGISRLPNFLNVPLQLGTTSAPAGGGAAWVAASTTRGDAATLQLLAGDQAGTFPVNVSAAGSGVLRSAAIMVTVINEGVPDFTLVPTPTTLEMSRGQFTPFSLEVRRFSGHTGAVAFSAVTDSPGNYVVEFTPPTSATSGNATVGVRVYASPNVTPGPHLLTLRGTVGSTVRTVVMTLVVF